MPGFSITADTVDPAALGAALKNNAAGAFASFEGWVRDHNEGSDVRSLEYESFRALADTEGQRILDEAVERFGIIAASAVHREGHLAIGDCAVWVGVIARHRGEAFAACRFVIDELKHRLPIWKKEHYADGRAEWVNCQHTHHHAPAHHTPALNEADFYIRQTSLPEIGTAGQAKLKAAKILIVGAGGLGSSASLALAGTGVGTIGLADHDTLSIDNLHRQTIYGAADIGKPKADLAAARLRALNPFIDVAAHRTKVTADNVDDLITTYDLVLDCTDNFTSKYLLNDACVRNGKPLVQASIYRFEGQLMTIGADTTSGCLRCLFPEPPAPGSVGSCAETGVLGTVPALFGTLQANEAVKHILGLGPSLDLLIFDLLSLQSQRIERARDPSCPACGDHPIAARAHGQDTIDYIVAADDTLQSLQARFRLVDVREDWECRLKPVPGALHIPTSAFDIALLDAPKDKPLLLICAKGVRSLAAANYLRGKGWINARNLEGGVGSLPLAGRGA